MLDSDLTLNENENEKEEGPALVLYGTNLTDLAIQGKIEEGYGRENELLELMEILVRRQKNNPVLLGEPGVGKSAIIELFAIKLINNLVPFVLEGRKLISLNLAKMIAGTRYRGDFEARFQRVVNEVFAQPNVMIFIDEIHMISGAGTSEGSMDAANLLKPILSRSGFQCIGATTPKEYQIIEKDPALTRRFQPILVKEPSVEETTHILYNLRPSLEAFHNVEILPGALNLAAELSDRYITDRFLPDKAIDLVDRAAAKEVIKLTNITQGSLASAIVYGGLKNIAKLKMEAFRRGDIVSEFLFQDVEIAYRDFLLKWIENPLTVPEKTLSLISPILQGLIDNMRKTFLTHVDKLLFADRISRKKFQEIERIKELSANKNEKIFIEFETSLTNKISDGISLYRICNYIFASWILESEKYENSISIYRTFVFFNKIFSRLKKNLILKYIAIAYNKKNNDLITVSEEDFFENDIDIEKYENSYEILNELEETKLIIIREFVTKLRPILKKGVVQTLKNSSEIKLSNRELNVVYSLLGYLSTSKGLQFLNNLEDPILIRQAKELGNFSGLKKCITQLEIRDLLTHITGVPVNNLSNIEAEKLANLETTLHKRVIGQEEAISAIAKAIRRSRLGIQNPNRPIASFFFCGPTGVGKTEVTKALTFSMFGSEDEMTRFDMSEFMEKFAISRLIGSPPGYIGYDEGGQLTDAVRKKPYSVVLLDEIEKAHPDILNILLQILEDGRLTDNKKRLVSFENTVIIMTSNAAAAEIQQIIKTEENISLDVTNKKDDSNFLSYIDDYAGVINFLKSPINENFLIDIQKYIKTELKKSLRNFKEPNILDKDLQQYVVKNDESVNTLIKLKSAVLEKLNTMFLPEFLNRLDDIIIFQPLKAEELRKICDILVSNIINRAKQKDITLIVDEKVRSKITKDGYNPAFGARPLRRLITKNIEDLLSETLLNRPSENKKLSIEIQLDTSNEIIAKINK